uniref:GH18 domain-containing protein n=1 Tax=Ditylenchus dipsaci TaxID=166011 RepID=A0A915E102_9BILA
MDQMLNDVLLYLEENNLDGFDYDWEFPVWSQNAKPTDFNGFATLLQKSHEKLHSLQADKYLLFVTVAAPYTIMDVGYDVAAVNRYADYVQIMNYDFHSYDKWRPFTGLNAPLKAEPYEVSVLGRMNSDYSTRHWLDMGFSLLNPESHSLYAVTTGPSSYGESTDYSLMCRLLKMAKVNYVWNEKAASPYLYFDDQWIGFEDRRSMVAKTVYAKQLNLGGVMIFALHADDYAGTCDEQGTRYPLIKAVKQELESAN